MKKYVILLAVIFLVPSSVIANNDPFRTPERPRGNPSAPPRVRPVREEVKPAHPLLIFWSKYNTTHNIINPEADNKTRIKAVAMAQIMASDITFFTKHGDIIGLLNFIATPMIQTREISLAIQATHRQILEQYHAWFRTRA